MGENNDQPSTATRQPSLSEVLQAEVKYLASISKDYQDKINSAKTSYKKTYYLKKLRKNNEKLFEMLVALDKAPKRTDLST